MKNIFLLGAGFSYDISNKEFPLMKEVNQMVAKVVDKEIADKYHFVEDDFEICLTRLDIDLSHSFASPQEPSKALGSLAAKRKLRENREKILDYLVKLFSMKEKQIQMIPTAEIFINNILKKDDIILTTNYDSYLENLLGPKRWSFHGGYGRRIRWGPIREENSSLLNIKIFKLHGSPAFRKIWWDPEHKGDIDLGIDKDEFPAFHSHLGNINDEGPYIILPSFIKPIEFNAISLLYQEAIEEVKTSDRLIIIGSSLREEDYMLWFILSYFNCLKTKILILDREPLSIKEDLINIHLFREENISVLEGKLTDRIKDLANYINN